MTSIPLAYAARVLVLIGGILMILFGLISLLSLAFTLPFRSPLEDLNIIGRGYGLIPAILGIVVIFAARYSNRLVWAIVLIVIGYLGGGIGGLLVLFGGVLGLVSVLMKKA